MADCKDCGRDHEADKPKEKVLGEIMRGGSPFGALLRLEEQGWSLTYTGSPT